MMKWFLVFMTAMPLYATVVTNNLNYTVIIPDEASKIEVFAANELSSFLGKIYSQNVNLNGGVEPITFFVGVGSEAEKAGFTNRMFCDDESIIVRRGRTFLFDGYDDAVEIFSEFGRVGTLTSVYVFLKKYAGLEFFYPGETGYRLPENPVLQFPLDEKIFKPSFSVRGFNKTTADYSEDEMVLFARRMLCSRPNWHRSKIYCLSDWKERFSETQPEILARDGEKVLSFEWGKKQYYSPCFTSDKAVRQAARDVIEMFDRDKSLNSVTFMADVPWLPCCCDQCTSSPLRIHAVGKDYSEEYFNFVARVGSLVFAAHPDCHLITHTKTGPTSYRNPPMETVLDKRIILEILLQKGHAFSPAVLQDNRSSLLAWNQTCGLTNVLRSRLRHANFDRKSPLIMPRHTELYLKNVHGLTTGDHGQELSERIYSFCALNIYIHCKFLADVDSDIDPLIKDFVRFAYPGAEVPMYDFYTEMENIWAATPFEKRYENPFLTIYTTNTLSRPLEYLNASKKIISKDEFFKPLYSAFMKFYASAVSFQPL